jgi:hypothetical protein
LIVAGYLALTSTRNKGSAFAAPLVSALIIIAVWALFRLSDSRYWKATVAGGSILVAIISFAPLIDLNAAVARPWSIQHPSIGKVMISDGRGSIQRYESDGGYAGTSPAIPIDPAKGAAWVAVSHLVAERIAGMTSTDIPVAFGVRSYLFNSFTVNLARLAGGDAPYRVADYSSDAGDGTAEDYKRWLTSGTARSACLLLSVGGSISEFPPFADPNLLARAAVDEGFLIADRWSLPDGPDLLLWRRNAASCDSSRSAGGDVEGLVQQLKLGANMNESARALGLTETTEIAGYVDSVSRIPDGSFRLSGWVLDKAGDGDPLWLVALVGGKILAVTHSAGPRGDIQATFELSGERAANLAFAMTVRTGETCRSGASLTVAAITEDNRFAVLPYWRSDGRCD